MEGPTSQNKGEQPRFIDRRLVINISMPKYINKNNIIEIEPIGPAQTKAFAEYAEGKNLFLTGSAGTGKTLSCSTWPLQKFSAMTHHTTR